MRVTVQLPDAVLHVRLASNVYAPVMVAVAAPPDVTVVACPVRLTAQPFGPEAMVAEMAPIGETVPEKVPTEPEMGPRVPWIAPFASWSAMSLVRFVPSD